MILGAAIRMLATPRALAPVGVAIVLGIAWSWHATQVRQARESGRAEIRAQWQAERLQAAEAAASAVQAARDIEAARVAALEGIAHDARHEAAAAVPLLAVPTMLLAACASAPQPLPPPPIVVPPPAIPPLPPEARQPPAPAWCSPTCSDALTSARDSWPATPIRLGPPGSPASGPTGR